ncbi:MAG: hypothetical protein WC454_09440, partial [Phycisphaerae bacterium]
MKIENLKLKIFLCAFVPLCLCASAFGFIADLNSDNTVDQFDLYLFSQQWLDTSGSADFDDSGRVDFKDFTILAAEWQGHLYSPPTPPHINLPPTANDISVSAVAYIPQTIMLSAADDGYPNPPGRLKYLITDLPADANAKVGGTKSGEQSPIRQSDLPYKLSSWGSSVIFATSTVGSTNFKYKVFDGNLYSDEKTVSITVAVNPKDCLSFDGSGSVSIPDAGNYFDLDPNRGIALFLNTRQLRCDELFCKYIPGSAGYKGSLINGRLRISLFDSTGLIKTVDCNTVVADGKWHQVGFIYDANGYLWVSECNSTNFAATNYEYTTTNWVTVLQRNYANDSNLI